ncbi:MAG: cobalamin-binding protein [Pseudonocardiales bacterium]|nr:cobalamin-binding protein [Pseudonocardiales bacterium]
MRIASLLPAATEIVLALGLEDRLAAVTFECAPTARARYPVVVNTAIPPGLTPAEIDAWVRDRTARGLPLYELDRAALAAVDPELILTQDLCRVCALPATTVAAACEAIGVDAEVLSLDPRSLDDVMDAVIAVGRAAGVAQAADQLRRSLCARLDDVGRAVAGRPRPRVLVLEWTDPPFLAGHWVPELVRRAGGRPVGAVEGGRTVAARWEDLPSADVVVVAPCGFGLDGALEQCAAVAAHLRPTQLNGVPLVAIDSAGYVVQAGPALVDGVEALAWMLHPDAVPEPPSGRIAGPLSPGR